MDLNLGFLASYLVSKSVLGPKRNPSLDAQLINNLNKYEGLLKSAEIEACKEIVRIVNKRNEQVKRVVPPNGIITRLKNWLTTRIIRSLDKRAIRKWQNYFNQEHLARVTCQYGDETHRMTRDHEGWYIYHIPPIDIGIISSELMDIQAASMVVGLDQGELKGRLLERDVPIYLISGLEIVERTRIDGLVRQDSLKAVGSP